MRKFTLLLITGLFSSLAFAQQDNFWNLANESSIGKDLFDATQSRRPSAYKIFSLNESAFVTGLRQAPAERSVLVFNSGFIVSMPMPDGSVQRFKIVDVPWSEPGLAVKFPDIRSYAGVGIENPDATIRISASKFGINASIMSAKQSTIYIDKMADNYYRVVYRKDLTRTSDHFQCLTEDIPAPIPSAIENADDGKLRTYRLAMISGAEFSNHFITAPLPTLTDSVNAVLAAQNSHVTRTNQVYERDFGVRLVLVANNNLLIYFDPATDPIANPNNPNGATMQATIDAAIGDANYDIGHTESKGSNNGNAGCIGCVCTSGSKGRGWTVYSNPSLLEFFVIDYLTHEIGHQFGANHTFSFQLEGSGVNIEPGSGVTIMGYAGITGGFDVAPHSIEIFSVKSIEQVTNYIKTGNGSTCDVETITGNAAPTANAGADFTIPFSTPFKLTGTATDPNPTNVLTYNWEQIDVRTGAFPSIPVPTATNGPMFRTYLDYTIPERTFPSLQYILTGANGFQWEVLPSVGRSLNFRFIVKDNNPGGGNNKSDDMVVTVNGSAGPFLITSQNSATNWVGGTSETITWSVNNTTAQPINCANVNILFSSDGGNNFTMLLANTPNDGSENITVPIVITSQGRIKVEAVGNIFFDINNANITVAPPPNGFSFNSPAPVTAPCPAPNVMTSGNLTATYFGTFTGNISLTGVVTPAGPTVSFSNSTLTTGSPSTTVSLTGMSTLSPGNYTVTVTGTGGAPTQTRDIVFTINPGTGPSITTQPTNQTVCEGVTANFSVVATGVTSYQWQFSNNGGATFNNIGGANTAAYSFPGAVVGNNGWQFRCVLTGQCGTTNTNAAILTVNTAPSVTAQPQDITLCAGANHTFSVTATGSGLTYQWQLSTDAGATYNNIGSATNNSYTLSGITIGMSGYRYRCVVSGSCPPTPVNSNGAILTVQAPVLVTGNPANQVVCNGDNASFTVAGSGSGIIYQWQVNNGSGFINVTNGGVYSGATTTTLVITGTNLSLNGYQYRCQLTSIICTTPATSNAATLTVNSLPAVTASPVNQTICSGSSTTFSVSGTGTGIVYQWQVNSGSGFTNISNGGVYSGATSATLTVTGATTALNGYQYRCVVSGTCPPAANSAAATLTVIAPVSITGSPADAVLCSGNNTSFTVTGTSTLTINYQWQVNTGSGFTNISNGGVYSGATTPVLAITGATTSMNSYQYRCLLSNVTCTTPTISGTALLTVRQTPTVTLSAAPLTSLLPGQTTTLTAVPSAQTLGTLTTSWTYNSNAVSNTGNTRVVNVEKVGSYRVSIQEVFTSPAITCSNQSAVVTIDALISDKLFIFPSPNDGNFTISYYNNGGTSTTRTIVIFDSKGAQVYNGKFPVTGAYTLIPINLQKGSRGIYYVVVGDVTGKKLAEGRVHVR